MLYHKIALCFVFISLMTFTSAYIGEPVVDYMVNLFTGEEAEEQTYTVSIITENPSWKIIDTTGNFSTYLLDGSDKKTHIGWYVKEGISPSNIDLTPRQLYDCDGNIILDDKNKPITLKYETNKIPNDLEADGMSDGYFLRLTDANAINIDTCIKLNPTVVYQSDSKVQHIDRGMETNVTLKKFNGEEYILSPDDLFLDTTDPTKLKYGAIDNSLQEGETASYKYILSSNGTYYEQDRWKYFYSDFDNLSSYTYLDFGDICNRKFKPYNFTRKNNKTVIRYEEKANCTFNNWKDENGINYLSVKFISDKYIDPFLGDGAGTSIDPYQITDWTELNDVRNYLSSYFVLNNDLNSSTTGFSSYQTGSGWLPISTFTGTFDGQNHTIDSLFIDRSGSSNNGLFGETDGATIFNVGLTNVDVTGSTRTGAIAGLIYASSIDNSFSTGVVSGTASFTGGLVGNAYNSPLDNTYSTVIVDSSSGSGGTGSLVGYFGGESVNLDNSYSTGDVTGSSNVGGLVGYTLYTSVDNSYSTGDVTGNGDVGGLIGYAYGSLSIDNSYWLNNAGDDATDCLGDGSNPVGCTAKTDINWFYSYSNAPMSSWDFATIWDDVKELQDHAVLQWQNFQFPVIVTLLQTWRSTTNGDVASMSSTGDFSIEGNLNVAGNTTQESVILGNGARIGYNATCSMIFYNSGGGIMSTQGCS